MQWCRVVFALAIACGPTATVKVTNRVDHAASASCPLATPRLTDMQLDSYVFLGRIGDRSWVLGRDRDNKRALLVTLDANGRPALFPIPIGSGDETLSYQIDGTTLRLLAILAACGGNARWMTIGLASETPRFGSIEQLPWLPHNANGFALGESRGLTDLLCEKPALQLFDPKAGRLVGAPVKMDWPFSHPQMRCVGDRCFAIGMLGDGRELGVVAFTADGPAPGAPAVLESRGASRVITLHDGKRTIVMWSNQDARLISARVLDETGTPGPLLPIEGLADAYVYDPIAVRGTQPRRVALRVTKDHTRYEWQIGTLSRDGEQFGQITHFALDATTEIAVAEMPDGTFVAAPDIGPDTVQVAFAAPGTPGLVAATNILPLLPKERRSGRAVPLTAPGWAGVFVDAPGNFDGTPSAPDTFVLVRAPCDSIAGQ